MDRNRDGRRASIVGSNGFNRRRHRTNSLRDSPDEDGGHELQESVRLRDRAKKDRDRERSSRSKRRRREDGGETSDESVNDEEEEDDGEKQNATAGGGVRLIPPQPGSVPNHHHHHPSFSQQHNSNSVSSTVNHHLQHRKSFPPSSSAAKVSRPPPVWKTGDEMIGVSVPRKARSASTKRSHDWISSSSNNNSGGGVSGDQNHCPGTSPPATHGVVSPGRVSPSSSNASMKKNPKPSVPKLKPPKASSKPSSSNPEELEIEIAEVLYGLMTQSQAPSSKKEEINRLNSDAKSLNSSPMSNFTPDNLNSGSNSSPLLVAAPKRKRPRQVPENSSFSHRNSPVLPKIETSSPNLEKSSGSVLENFNNSVNMRAPSANPDLVLQPIAEETITKEEIVSPEERESPVVRAEISNNGDSPLIVTATASSAAIKVTSVAAEMQNKKKEKIEIDLMAPPPQGRSSPEREVQIDFRDLSVDQTPNADNMPKIHEAENGIRKDHSSSDVEKKGKVSAEEAEPVKARNSELHQNHLEKTVHSSPLPLSMPGWPAAAALPTMGYMPPFQGVVSMDGSSSHIQSQPRPKRCATHCHIARNILCLQQFMKMNPFWPPPAGTPPLFASKPAGDVHGNVAAKGVSLTAATVAKDQSSNSNPDAARKQQQILIQQPLPPVAPTNLLGPTLFFPGVAPPRPSSGTSTTAPTSASQPATAMSFNYPNMPTNETQYLAILQNNGYPFPIPNVGASQNYRGNPAQAMPIFNGPFYSSQMIHPSQVQSLSHQNASASSGSSSQKHLPGQKGQGVSTGSGNMGMPNFPSQKTQQPAHNQFGQPSRSRQHHEGEPGSEDSLSTTDSRTSMNIYGQSFSLPIHPQNFALMTSPATPTTNQNDKKAHQPQQQQGLKMASGSESLPPHGFAMSFGTINGGNMGPTIDISSMTQNHAMFQSSPETAARQMMVTAQKKSFRISDDGKSGGESSSREDERKSLTGGQSIAFTRQDLSDQGNGGSRSKLPMTTNSVGSNNSHNMQAQIHHQQQQQIMQLKHHQQQQQLAVNAANRSKMPPVTSNGSIYPDNMNSSKFPNFPQNLNSTQSPQWKSQTRAPSSSTTTAHKSLARTQPQMHTQISFGGNQKPPTTSQQAPPPTAGPGPSSPMMVGSPTTSKGASGSPRTNSSSSTNKMSQPAMNSPSGPTQKSPSVLGSHKPQPEGQLYFSQPYSQPGYYMNRRRPEQHQQGPVNIGTTNTNDPATAIAAATAKGMMPASQFPGGTLLPAGFSYLHPVQMKSAEQKQPSGDDNLHKWQPEKK